MKMTSKSLVLMALLLGVSIQAAEIKEDAAQKVLDQELCKALEASLTDKVRDLLLQGANPNYDSYNNPLYMAIATCNLQAVELLLCQGANPNPNFRYNKPLPLAVHMISFCRNPHKAHVYAQIAGLLLHHGANANEKNLVGGKDEKTLLNQCIYVMNNWINMDFLHVSLCDAIGLLLEYGADDTACDAIGKNIHDYAQSNPELQKILKEHAEKAKKEIAAVWDKLPIDVVNLCGDKLHVTDIDRGLHAVVRAEWIADVEMLFKQNADPNVTLDGGSALLAALGYFNVPMVRLLLEAKADPNATVYLDDGRCVKLLEGSSILASIKKCKQDQKFFSCAELLLQHRADVNALNSNGDPYIAAAVKSSEHELAKLFLKYGADPEKGGKYGSTAYTYLDACINKPEMQQILLGNRLDSAKTTAILGLDEIQDSGAKL